MEKSLFWDAKSVDGVLDRTYSSDDFAAMFQGFWGDGVIPNRTNALLVEPLENSMSVYVCAGDAFVGGRFYQSTSDVKITLDTCGDADRVDLIALRFDAEKRTVHLKYLEGAEGMGQPSYARTDTLYDLILARITIPANAQYLEDSFVEDLRGTELCPWLSMRWSLDEIQEQFEKWYAGVRELLNENVAKELSDRIDRNRGSFVKDGTLYINSYVYDEELDGSVD